MSDRTVWDEKAHLDLLMAIMSKVTITSNDWASILPELQAKGYNYTLSAAVYAYGFPNGVTHFQIRFSLPSVPLPVPSAHFPLPTFHLAPNTSHSNFHLIFQLTCPSRTFIFPDFEPSVHQPQTTGVHSIITKIYKQRAATRRGTAFTLKYQSPFIIIIIIMETTPTKGAVFKWTAEAERDLFAACLVVTGEPKGATLKNAMDLLNGQFGERFTQKAASHRL